MGGKARKKPKHQAVETALDRLTEDRSDYFVGDLDAGGITVTPPPKEKQ